MMSWTGAPIVHVCGFSGAGKTTLVLGLLKRLHARGLRALVLKHDAHGLLVDRPRKDTARVFAAGADVLARDAKQEFARRHEHADSVDTLDALLARELPRYDVIFVEGYKDAALPNRIWLRRHLQDTPPHNRVAPCLDLDRRQDRIGAAWLLVERIVEQVHESAPLLAGILIGGRSSRMGSPKHLLRLGDRSWVEHIAGVTGRIARTTVLLGAGTVPPALGDLPRLFDAPDRQGPAAGMIAAMRWHPRARWVFAACDTPLITHEALQWLIAQATAGVCAVLPRRTSHGRSEPFPGIYAPRALALLERARGPAELTTCPGVLSPIIPPGHRQAWRNVNTLAQALRVGASRLQAARTTSLPGGNSDELTLTTRRSASI